MRSITIDGFVIASRNLGNISMKDGKLEIGYLFRSAHKSLIDDMMAQTTTLAGCFGSNYEEEYRYSGYTCGTDTPLINLFKDVYKEASGQDLKFLYIHGGTDAGTIIDNMGGMDTISIGPNTYDYHRPGERLDIASFDRTYGYLTTILSRL